MRLLLITLGTLVVMGMIVLTVRFWGLGQSPQIFEHPWFQVKTPWVVTDLANIDRAQPAAFLWLDILRSDAGGLYALRGTVDLSKTRFADSELAAEGEPLAQVLARYPKRNLILNLRSNLENIDLQLSELVGTSGEGRVLMQSDYDVLLKSVKKLQPLWLYGSSQGDRVRLATFDSMWLLPAAPFKGDVYVGPFKKRNVPLVSETLVQELKRRGKKVILGPIESKDEYEQALRLGADGVFIEKSELLGLTL